MSKERALKNWRKRLENYDGDDKGVEAWYYAYIRREKATDLSDEIVERIDFVSGIVDRVLSLKPSPPHSDIKTFAEYWVGQVIDRWLTEHEWWDAFTKWVISEIEYEELNAG